MISLRRAPLTFLIGLTLSLLALPIRPMLPAARAQNPCDGLVAPRLSVGVTARVLTPLGLSLKNQPATGAAGATEVALLPFGTVAAVLNGYECHYGYLWWQLQLANGITGWAAEGSKTDYFLELMVVGLHAFQIGADGAQIAHYFITPDGTAQPTGLVSVPPLNATPGDGTWQQVEIDALTQALDATQQNCPDRLKGTIWEVPDALANPLTVPLPTLEYDTVPSPDGSRLLLVRHLRLDVPVCGSVLPAQIGMDRVSILNADGTENVLFPYPQHGTIPPSQDSYALSAPDLPVVYLDEIVWSPQSKTIAFAAAYRDQCSGQGCYRFQMYVANLDTSQLYVVGEGRHVGWASGGERINLFRLINEGGGQKAHLYTMRPDGTDRQEIWLPGGAIYTSKTQTGLGLPWNESGTRVMVLNAGEGEVMLFTLNDRSFTPAIVIPDLMPQVNRLAVFPIKGETALLWVTIRGDFVTQDVKTGDWKKLTSTAASTGVPPVQVRPFSFGSQALVELADGTAYILDVDADTLTPVAFSG